MLQINNITIKNFLSVGNISQAIKFNDRGLTLILGENLDQGGNGARNGVGKSTIIQALSYGLYDSAITPIKKDNLINKTNSKNMIVSVDFSVNGKRYKVERGRKPNIFKLFVDGIERDESQGENRNTQEELVKILGMSYDMFKHIVALSTYTQPFLFMRQNDQRVIIEELLGITQLSQKADILKKQSRKIRQSIRDEEVKIQTISDSNKNIEDHIRSLKAKSLNFENKKVENLEKIAEAITDLEKIDIEIEIESHKKLTNYEKMKSEISQYSKYVETSERQITNLSNRIEKITEELNSTKDKKCPLCKSELHTENHKEILNSLNNNLNDLTIQLDPILDDYKKYSEKLDSIGKLPEKPVTFYSSIDEAYLHKQNLNQLEMEIVNENSKDNPFEEQIQSLSENVIQELDYTHLNELKKISEHQDFLYKLLTSKESFIRKKIIEQNLSYLNQRLNYYLSKMGLPHSVEFKNDLSVEIILLGQEFDFGQLSRGQQNRLILALSWAFRDVWESTGHPINVLFIDEMIDSGIDTLGVENTLEILKKMSRERNKDIFLISHKEELMNRVHNMLMVIMENGFTQYQNDMN